MSVVKQIFKNSVINISGKLISLVLGLISVAIMTRYLGQEGFGYYATVVAFLQFFGILADLGISLTTIQMISPNTANTSKIMNNIMSFRVITALIFLIVASVLIWLFPYNIFIKLGVLITVASYFASSIIQTLTGVFQKELKMVEVTIAEISGRILLVLIVVVTCLAGKDIYWIFGGISLGSLLNLIILYVYSRKYISWQWEVDLILWREIWHRTWPLALSISFNLVYLKTDTIILSLTHSQSDVGLYGATYRVIDILTMMPAVFMGIVLPIITKYFQENNRPELFKIMQRAFDVLIAVAIPIVLGTFIIGIPLMKFVAGEEFAQSGEILKVLILAAGAIFAGGLFGYGVVGINKQRVMTWGYLTTAVITLAGYLILIPRYGYWSAAWMTVFSETMVMIWTAIVVKKYLNFFPSLKIFIKSLPAAILMCCVLYVFKEIHVLVLLLISVAIYFPCLFLFGGIKKDTIRELIGQRGKPLKVE